MNSDNIKYLSIYFYFEFWLHNHYNNSKYFPIQFNFYCPTFARSSFIICYLHSDSDSYWSLLQFSELRYPVFIYIARKLANLAADQMLLEYWITHAGGELPRTGWDLWLMARVSESWVSYRLIECLPQLCVASVCQWQCVCWHSKSVSNFRLLYAAFRHSTKLKPNKSPNSRKMQGKSRVREGQRRVREAGWLPQTVATQSSRGDSGCQRQDALKHY